MELLPVGMTIVTDIQRPLELAAAGFRLITLEEALHLPLERFWIDSGEVRVCLKGRITLVQIESVFVDCSRFNQIKWTCGDLQIGTFFFNENTGAPKIGTQTSPLVARHFDLLI